jgi:hypothetical protein
MPDAIPDQIPTMVAIVVSVAQRWYSPPKKAKSKAPMQINQIGT